MQNIGEEIAGEYLKVILGCDFVEYNLSTPDTQGEIDVVGINAKEKRIYICEVAIHLVTGLQYVNPKLKRPDNVNRFCKKFRKNIEFAQKYFSGYETHFMLWSPVVKNQKATSKNNQLGDIQAIQEAIQKESGIMIEAVINLEYSKRLEELRAFARKETKELKSSVLRLMQIEEKLNRHLNRMESNQAG